MLCFGISKSTIIGIRTVNNFQHHAQVTIAPVLNFRCKPRTQTSSGAIYTIRTFTNSGPRKMSEKKEKKLPEPRPSASVLLISPENEILLLHRIQKSSAFPSAHVFPGGNCDPQDGSVPDPSDPKRHEDNSAYRMCAIRETFEESGILLAKNAGFGRLIEVEDSERDKGRKSIHSGEIGFEKWLSQKGGRADVDALIPFTRWVTPTNVPKRFTTQMYVYFLPLQPDGKESERTGNAKKKEVVIPVPKSDGGIEHTAAQFLPPSKWIEMAQSGEIILFPPQLFLLQLIAPYLSPNGSNHNASYDQLKEQRNGLRAFLKTSDPPWGDKCISPTQLFRRKSDSRVVLGLDKPGPELRNSNRKGEWERVVLVNFKKEGPRDVEVKWRKDVFAEEKQDGKL